MWINFISWIILFILGTKQIMESIKEGKAQQALIRSSLIPTNRTRAASSATSTRPAKFHCCTK